ERDGVVQVDPARRASLGDIATLPIATPMRGLDGAAPTVPLGQIASIETGVAPAQIDRSDLERVVTVSANTEPGYSVQEASGALNANLANIALPDGYSRQLGGETEELQETFGYVIESLLL